MLIFPMILSLNSHTPLFSDISLALELLQTDTRLDDSVDPSRLHIRIMYTPFYHMTLLFSSG